jgi:hypothetical protein
MTSAELPPAAVFSLRRDGVAIGLGALAVLLAIIHLGTVAAQRESMQAALAASDSFSAAQAMIARETVLLAHANAPGLDRDVRAGELVEAMRLRHEAGGGNRAGGIEQMTARSAQLRAQSQAAAARAGGLALGESALQLAILMLAVALVLNNRAVQRGAMALGGVGVAVALAAGLGFWG